MALFDVRRTALLIVCLVVLASCGPTQAVQQTPRTTGTFRPIPNRDLRIVTGQTVYIPAYSEAFFGTEDSSAELAVTLAIHNTDLDASIIITSVRYYDTDGNLVLDYIDEPIEVSPLATTGYLVEEGDQSGGWGANFVVEWVAEEPVYEPVIEALMVSTVGLSGISIISTGRVLSSQVAPEEPPTE